MRKILQIIPVQQNGKKSDIIERITAKKEDNAMILYHTACDRLLNINGWKEFSQGLSAEFCLIDQTLCRSTDAKWHSPLF